MTLIIALLSEYVMATIEDASDSWGLSVSFLSIILLPILGNAAEHAGAIIFASKNKFDITLGVALGSAAQIAIFVSHYIWRALNVQSFRHCFVINFLVAVNNRTMQETFHSRTSREVVG